MIVDDNAMMRKAIRGVASKPYDSVIECESGEQAISAFVSFDPDWVLMDIQMGDQDGISVTKAIMRTHPKAKIIMVTDYDTEAFRSASLKAGACGYVSKSNLFDLEGLLHSGSVHMGGAGYEK